MAYPAPGLTPPFAGEAFVRPVKQAITASVVKLFNDTDRGEKPVKRRVDGLFGPRAVAWRVHGDVAGMMVGGVTALLLQMLHPAVLAGVWDHSKFRTDMQGPAAPHRAVHRADHLWRPRGGGGGDRPGAGHP